MPKSESLRRPDRPEGGRVRRPDPRAGFASKEEEIRIEVEKQLAFIQKEAGIKLEGKHEFTVASGRVDSVYNRVIIEYKNPASPGDRIGPKADSPGSKKVVEQIKKRFYDMRTEHGQPLNTALRRRAGRQPFHLRPLPRRQVAGPGPGRGQPAFGRAVPLGAVQPGHARASRSRRSTWPATSARRASSRPGRHPRALRGDCRTDRHPKAQTFFSQWKILFGEVCGYDVDNPSDKIKKLADFYGVPAKASSRPSCSSPSTPTTRSS